jgi:hypothetical protein
VASSRYRTLLAVAAVLAALRFLVVPWIQAQSDARDRLQVLSKRLDRSVGVLQNEQAIRKAAAQLEAALQQARDRFPTSASLESFRLENQQRLGAVVSSGGSRVALFDWVMEGAVPGSGLAYSRMRFQVEGALRDIVRVHGDIEGSLPNLVLRELQISVASPAGSLGENTATMTVVADLYHRPQGGA